MYTKQSISKIWNQLWTLSYCNTGSTFEKLHNTGANGGECKTIYKKYMGVMQIWTVN